MTPLFGLLQTKAKNVGAAAPAASPSYPTIDGTYAAVWDPDEQGYADAATPATMTDSVNGYTMNRVAPGNEFTYAANTWGSNGAMVASVAHTEAMLCTDAALLALVQSASWAVTMIWVGAPGDTGYTEHYAPFWGGTHYWGMKATLSTTLQVFGTGSTGAAELLTTGTPQPSSLVNALKCYTLRGDMGATRRFNLRVNGVAHSNNTPAQTGPLSSCSKLWYTITNGVSESFEGKMGTLMVFDGFLSDTDCALVEAYMMTRYGL